MSRSRYGKPLNTIIKLPVAQEGLYVVFAFLGAASLLLFLHKYLIFIVFLGLAILVSLFFRNPKRNIDAPHNSILAPADGKVVAIETTYESRFLKKSATKISIFMSLFNVHMNRVPIAAMVKDRKHRDGKFTFANRDKASLDNEQNAILLETSDNTQIVVVQIAGWIARRIVCYAQTGDHLNAGDVFGLIKFGSRVDLYVPSGLNVRVNIGDMVRAGKTIVGVLDGIPKTGTL